MRAGYVALIVFAVLAASCGGGSASPAAPDPSAPSAQSAAPLGNLTLSPWLFSPAANAVFHSANDTISYQIAYAVSTNTKAPIDFTDALVFIRDDGAPWLVMCDTGEDFGGVGTGHGGYHDVPLGNMYAWGLGHRVDAVILGLVSPGSAATFTPGMPTPPPPCPFGTVIGTFGAPGSVNFAAATARLDVPLNWTMQ